jgi:hypothetical protein
LSDNIKEPLFKNCSSEVKKEQIKGLFLTDEETAKIKLVRADMRKVAEPFQDEVRYFVAKWKQDFLIERAQRAYNDVNEGRDPKIRFSDDGYVCLFDEVMRAMVRHSDKKCLKKFHALPKEILRSLTRPDVLEEVYKIAVWYKENKSEDEPYCPEAEYQNIINDIYAGKTKEFRGFSYKGRKLPGLDGFFYKDKLIFEIPDDELPYSALRELKDDQRFWLKYRWTINKYLIELRSKEAGHQSPTKRSPDFQGLLKSNRPIDNFIDTEQRTKFKKLREAKCPAHIRENILSECRKKGISLGYRRRNIRW